jgi:two-component system heavy metal sensor histidine kinase CusS
VIQGIIAEASEAARRRGIVFEGPPDLDVEIMAHPELLRIAIRNLVTNAVVHSPEGSRVSISIAANSDHVDLDITNPAPNLDADDLEHMFESFWRKDPSRTGSNHAGLGLSITQAIADSLHMSVAVELTRDGQFTVRLRGPSAAGIANT